MIKQTLCGTWRLEDISQTTSLAMTVPGSVLSTLIEHNKIEDPYFGVNEYAARELFRQDYRINRSFEVDESLLIEEYIDLICYGLDTLAEVYVNQKLVLCANNMHRTWKIACKEFLHSGKNEISILFKAPITYIENYEAQEGKEIEFITSGAMKGNQYLRKAHSMFGWDWGAQLPDAGIWREIELVGYSNARIEDVLIRQIHEKTQVQLEIKTSLEVIQAHSYRLQYVLKTPSGEIEYMEETIHESVGETTCTYFTISNPELWWPNGYGKQPLYQLEVFLYKEEEILDKKEFTIGLRTLTISQEKDQWGEEFAFIVNGIKIFTRGANYIPEDCIYSWITKDRMEYLIESSVRANFNCLRIWGGGYYPSDAFYELCDKYGIIVWQDLMYACNIYELTEEFAENIVAEAKDNVRRLRHHPSLGLWCGNNEIESAWENWGGFKDHSKALKADYIKQFEYLLPKAVKEVDPNTFYWPSSPSSGGCFDDPDSQDKGDTHYWDVWHGQKPFSDYQKYFFRFCSEFGFQSFPSIKTIETFTEEEDRNIFSKVMESHQKNNAANGKILYYISETFKYPKDFESLTYVSQLLQGMAIKSGVEHWRRNRGRCMGTLYWQLNDNWPVASWSSIDYYGRWKALHYMAKKFYAPCAPSLVKNDKQIEVYIQNESLIAKDYEVTLRLKKLDFTILDEKKYSVTISALSSMKVARQDYSTLIQGIEDEVFVEAVFETAEQIMVESEIFVPYKHLKLKEPKLKLEVEEEDSYYNLRIETNTFTPFVVLDLKEADAIFEDNYFTLTDSKQKSIRLEKKDILIKEKKIQEKVNTTLKRQLTLTSLWNTY